MMKYTIPPEKVLQIEYDSDMDILTLWNGVPASNGSSVARGLTVFSDDKDDANIITLENAAELLRPYLFPARKPTLSERKGAMGYAINHVHIRAADPHASAAWYEKHFGAKVLSAREVMPGTITIGMELEGPVRLNISSQKEGSPQDRPVAELNRLGLEHFGFVVDDIDADMERLEAAGVRVVLPITEVAGGGRLSYVEGPDDVLIELVQRRD